MQLQILFGRRLRELRWKAGLTQEALAEATQISPVSISNIERGIHAPAFWRLGVLAHALSVEIHELFMFSGKEEND